MAHDPGTDPYAVLGVVPAAGHDDIRRAWLALARRHHPDQGGDAAAMRAVNEAWSILGDPARRRAWDREHGGSGAPPRRGESAPERDGDLGIDPDLLDPRPLAPPVRSRFDIVPVIVFGLAVATGCLALALDEPGMLGVAVFLFFLSCLSVAAVAMLSMRRSVRAGR